jgi:hypothetical protein
MYSGVRFAGMTDLLALYNIPALIVEGNLPLG